MFWVSPAEILSFGLTLRIHLTTIVSFLSSWIASSSLTGKVWLPHILTIHVLVIYNPHFAPTSKTLLVSESGKCSTLLHPFLILATTLSIASPLASIVPSSYSKLNIFNSALNRGWCMFKGGTYSKSNIFDVKVHLGFLFLKIFKCTR